MRRLRPSVFRRGSSHCQKRMLQCSRCRAHRALRSSPRARYPIDTAPQCTPWRATLQALIHNSKLSPGRAGALCIRVHCCTVSAESTAQWHSAGLGHGFSEPSLDYHHGAVDFALFKPGRCLGRWHPSPPSLRRTQRQSTRWLRLGGQRARRTQPAVEAGAGLVRRWAPPPAAPRMDRDPRAPGPGRH